MIPEHSLRSIGNQTPEEALEPFLAPSDDRGRLASYALMLKCELGVAEAKVAALQREIDLG